MEVLYEIRDAFKLIAFCCYRLTEWRELESCNTSPNNCRLGNGLGSETMYNTATNIECDNLRIKSPSAKMKRAHSQSNYLILREYTSTYYITLSNKK